MNKKLINLIFLIIPSLFLAQENDEILHNAMDEYNSGDMEKAKELFEQFTAVDTTNADVYYYLGMIESRDFLFGGFDEFNRAIELDSNHVGALMARGNYYSYTGEEYLALSDYLKAYNIDPTNGGVLYNLAGSKRANGDIDGALQSYTELILLNDHNKFHAFAERGEIYLEKKEFKRAIEDFELAIKEGYPFCEVYEHIGDAHFQINNVDLACKYWNQAVKHTGYGDEGCESITKKIKKNCK